MKVATFLPLFSGFYHSIWSENIDFEEEQIIEAYNEENGTNLNWSDFNWKYDYERYSKAIAEGIINYIKEEYPNLITGYEFEKLVQPKEYNFSTDSINISLEVDKAVLMALIAENREKLTEKIKEKYTSCSGFISWHSNKYEDWFEDIVTEQDHEHKVGSIIGMICEDDFEESSISEWVQAYEYIDYEVAE